MKPFVCPVRRRSGGLRRLGRECRLVREIGIAFKPGNMLRQFHPRLGEREPQRLIVVVLGLSRHCNALFGATAVIQSGPHRKLPDTTQWTRQYQCATAAHERSSAGGTRASGATNQAKGTLCRQEVRGLSAASDVYSNAPIT